MLRARLAVPILLGLALPGSPLRAQEPSASSAGETVSLSGPEVTKLDWNTRALQSADLDGDGRLDLLVINNDRATVEILYQQNPDAPAASLPRRTLSSNRWDPVLEDSRFRKGRVTTGVTMYDLAVGDFNGDSRPDLAFTGDSQALTLRLQQPDGSWLERKVPDAPTPLQFVGSLRAADLDADGRTDLVVLGGREIAVYFQSDKGEFLPPVRAACPDEGSYGLELVDVEGDRHLDIVYLSSANRDGFRLRVQTAPREFGPERALRLNPTRSTLQLLRAAADGQPPVFAFARDQTGAVESIELRRGANVSGTQLSDLRPRVFTPRLGVKAAAVYTMGDFDSDGRRDLAVSDVDGAQVFVYLRSNRAGFAAAQRYPSLIDGRSLASGDWDNDGRDELFIASPKEQTVAVTRLDAEGRMAYPQALPATGRPIVIAAGRIGPDRSVVLAILKEEQGTRSVELWKQGSAGAERVQSVALPAMKTDPRGLRLADVNQDGLLDLVVFSATESMRFFLQEKSAETGAVAFRDAMSGTGTRRGLVDSVEPSAFSLGDLDGDGVQEMLIARPGIVRVLAFSASGELSVVDQINAKDSAGEIAAAFVLPTEKGAKAALLLYDRKGERFDVCRADETGVYQVVDTIPVGKIDVVGAEGTVGAEPSQTEYYLLGRDRFWWLPLGAEEYRAETIASHASDLPGVTYSDVIAGDLTADGQVDLIAVDPVSNLIEVLVRDAAGEWRSRLHFKVFETDEHVEQRNASPLEPRETVVADVTGDGKSDLILLVHDRVLVYPQK